MKGSKGVIGCPYLNPALFEKFGEVFAVIPAKDLAGMLDEKVTAATPKARELGIEVGMHHRHLRPRLHEVHLHGQPGWVSDRHTVRSPLLRRLCYRVRARSILC